MTLSRSIIAATNFSSTANNAISYAAGFAKATGAKLILFNSFSISIHSANSRISAEAIQKELDAASLRLETIGRELSDLFAIEVDCFCSYSFLEEQLLALIHDTNAELVVMGMADCSLHQDLMGNATTSIIKNINIPVLAVPINAGFVNLKKIFFALDREGLSPIQSLGWFAQKVEALKTEVEIFDLNQRLPELIKEQYLLGVENKKSDMAIKLVYKNIQSNTVIREIKQEIENYNANLLVITPQKYGFWDSVMHISKTRIMASGLEIPLLSLPNF